MPVAPRPVIPGSVSGKLTVVKEVAPKIIGNNRKQRMCLCVCECGTSKEIPVARFFDGGTVSCGCHRIGLRKTHGLSKTPVWYCYNNMVARCTNENSTYFEIYGGRGITVCDRWLESFENFLEDMGIPEDGLTLDRIDPDGNYEPANCRWVNMSVQGYNRRILDSNTTGRTGVTLTKDGKYRARINVGLERITVYYGDSFNAAVKAREEAEMKYCGELKPEAREVESAI